MSTGGSPGTDPSGGSGAMFDRIAPRYDLMNRLISLGMDQSWRRRLVRSLGLGAGARVLDLATGTADVALAIAGAELTASVVGLDPSPGMLDIGRGKIAAAGLAGRIELVEGGAEALPFADASFDACSMAFGIRNVPDRGRALAEMARVTRPGGRIGILELSEPRSGALAPFARFHIHTLVPSLGALLSGSREYRYLERSIAAFPSPAAFADLMRDVGLVPLETTPLAFGASHLYVAAPAEAR